MSRRAMTRRPGSATQTRSTARPVVALLSAGRNTGRALSAQLRETLGHLAEIRVHSLENGFPGLIRAEVAIVTHPSLTADVGACLGQGVSTLYARRSPNLAHIDKLLAIPPGSSVLLVNDTEATAIETIEALVALGLDHVKYTPYYPGEAITPSIASSFFAAVTPGELQHVPKGFSGNRTIDIGPRLLDFTTLVEVLQRLGCLGEEAARVTGRYLRELVGRTAQLASAVNDLSRTRAQLEAILELVDEGIVAVDGAGKVVFANPPAHRILGRRTDPAEALGLLEVAKSGKAEAGVICSVGTRKIVVTKVPLPGGKLDTSDGVVATLREAGDIRGMELRLRAATLKPGLVAKYSFSDILGESTAVTELKRRAAYMSGSDATVLICGESGTGKELFAQAIHAASQRRDKPFVAVNCAALPETLLESELFGYEEGAFTGARRGGKPGLFELAHLGTVFLDEVAEMPIGLQARLLRVLQELEVMRIGGTRVVPVDVRVIAATQVPLEDLRMGGRLRHDLYYRLSVLPLALSPLRDHAEDVPLLAQHFWQRLNTDKQRIVELPQGLVSILKAYPWPGNVRELENAVIHIYYISQGVPSVDDLPLHILQWRHSPQGSIRSPEYSGRELYPATPVRPSRSMGHGADGAGDTTRLCAALRLLDQPSRAILSLFASSAAQTLGRRSILDRLRHQHECDAEARGGLLLGEGSIRTRLRHLVSIGVLEQGRGRQGSRLTDFGRQVAAHLVDLPEDG